MKQPTLVIIKPDAIRKQLAGKVFSKFSVDSLEILAIRIVKTTQKLVEEHYRHLKDAPYFKKSVSSLLGTTRKERSLIAMILYGEDSIKKCREIAGATNPEEAKPTTIRGAYGRITTNNVYENVVHVSSSVKESEREIKLWFGDDKIVSQLYSNKQKINKT
ncbi:MAG: nucleoside-diphosphate kinase [Candidatus Zapsychrus exili]|nr:nucleoside-diphosphate kinase [Candidatus Zapsychrus exili]